MRSDRVKWDRLHAAREGSRKTSDLVSRYSFLAPQSQGRALVLAAGTGRNAIYLAQQGFAVDAVDISLAGLQKFPENLPNLFPVCADLDDFPIAAGKYALILNIRFLFRHLFTPIKKGLLPGGVLIFQTFVKSDGAGEVSGPKNREHYLHQNELLETFQEFQVHHYREEDRQSSRGPARMASLVATKPLE